MKTIIVGKSGSGKDFLKNLLVEKGLKPSVSCTTRPPRKGEVDGETYHFLSKNKFHNEITIDSFVEWKIFNGWYYGTRKSDWERADVFIMTPAGIKDIINNINDEDYFIIYLDIDKKIRKERILSRLGNADSVERRILADELDFEHFSCYNHRITDPYFTLDRIVNSLKIEDL